MSSKIYLLIDLVYKNGGQVCRGLCSKLGIMAVDVLEGHPDLLVCMEAPERQQAAKYLMDLLNSIDGMINDIQILPVQESTAKVVMQAGSELEA